MVAGDTELIIYRTYLGTECITYNSTQATNSRLMDYEWSFNENYPRELKVTLSNGGTGTDNLISSTFNGWVPGIIAPLDIGMFVTFKAGLSSTGVLTPIFGGYITDLKPDTAKGTLTITAQELNLKYEGIKSDKMVFANYRDNLITHQIATTAGSDYWGLNQLTDANISVPFTKVEYASGDSTIKMYESTPTYVRFTNGQLAQHWLNVDSDGLLGVRFYVENLASATAHTITVHLCADDNTSINGGPGTSLITNTTASIPGGQAAKMYNVLFSLAGGPYPVIPGKSYWLKFVLNTGGNPASDANTGLGKELNPEYVYEAYPYYSYWTGSAWLGSRSALNIASSLALNIDLTKWETIGWSDCVWTPPLLVVKLSNFKPAPQFYNGAIMSDYATQSRGRVSYFYGQVTAKSIASTLTGLSKPISSDLYGLIFLEAGTYYDTKVYPIWRVGSNFVGDSMRELLDGYCVYDGTNYCQGVMACYYDTFFSFSPAHLKWSKRQAVARDAPYAYGIFSTLAAPTPDRQRIISNGLRKTSKRPASVMVVGKDSSGLPICAHRDDRGAWPTSFLVKSRLLLTEYITNDNITTLEQADEIAKARLDMNTRDVWEGEVVVSGTWPDLEDLDITSNTFGSGQIATITDPALGLESALFKVRGIRLTPETTTLQLTNYDFLLENKYNSAVDRASRTETQQAPTDSEHNIFLKFFAPIYSGNQNLYMELQNAAGTAITTTRMLCKAFVDNPRNTVVYHAEFEQGNGTTVDATMGDTTGWIAKAALYTGITGGTAVATCQLGTAYYTPKWSGTRIIAEFGLFLGDYVEPPITPPTPPDGTPSAPTLTSAVPGDEQVVLTWTAPTTGTATGYHVYQGAYSGGELILTTLGNVLTYTDTLVDNAVTYYYKVSAFNTNGEGPLSNELTATPIDTTPVPPTTGFDVLIYPSGSYYKATRTVGGAVIVGSSSLYLSTTFAAAEADLAAQFPARTTKKIIQMSAADGVTAATFYVAGPTVATGHLVATSHTTVKLLGTVKMADNAGNTKALIYSDSVHDVLVVGGTWDGNKGMQISKQSAKDNGYVQRGLRFDSCTDICIQDCIIRNQVLEGIVFLNCTGTNHVARSGSTSTYTSRITGCELTGMGRYAIALFGNNVSPYGNSYIFVANNNIHDAGDYTYEGGGIYVYTQYTATQEYIDIYKNTIKKSTSDGISLYPGNYAGTHVQHCLVDSNTLIDTSYDGLHAAISVGFGGGAGTIGVDVGYCDSNTITGNIIYESGAAISNTGTGGHGTCYFIAVRGSSNVVTGNQLQNSYKNFICVWQGGYNIITGNTITNTSSYSPYDQQGIWITSDHNTISYNNINRTQKYWITIEGGANNEVHHNTMTNHGTNTCKKGTGNNWHDNTCDYGSANCN